jgi:histone H3/H4
MMKDFEELFNEYSRDTKWATFLTFPTFMRIVKEIAPHLEIRPEAAMAMREIVLSFINEVMAREMMFESDSECYNSFIGSDIPNSFIKSSFPHEDSEIDTSFGKHMFEECMSLVLFRAEVFAKSDERNVIEKEDALHAGKLLRSLAFRDGVLTCTRPRCSCSLSHDWYGGTRYPTTSC